MNWKNISPELFIGLGLTVAGLVGVVAALIGTFTSNIWTIFLMPIMAFVGWVGYTFEDARGVSVRDILFGNDEDNQ